MNLSDYTWDLTDAATVAQNQQGQLTSRQQTLLLQMTPWPVFGCLFYAVLFALTTSPFWWPYEAPLPAFMMPLYIAIFGSGGLLIVVSALWQLWQVVVQRQEFQHGQIAQATGAVRATRKGYAAYAAGVKLRAHLQKVDLLPGAYHFYYFPRSRYLLSAQPLDPDVSAGQANLQQNLGRTFRFNDNDLTANRAGQLSARQRLRLLWRIGGYSLLLVGLVTIATAMVVASTTTTEGRMTWWQIGILGLALVTALGWLAHTLVMLIMDLLWGQMKTAVGRVHVHTRSQGRGVQVYYVVNGIELPVKASAYYALVDGLQYRVYYTSRSKTIMSIEPV